MYTQKVRSFLDAVYGYSSTSTSRASSDRPILLGTIDPAYIGGLVRVKFDGETTMGQKGYTWLSTYVPKAGDRVILTPAGTSYVITGKVEVSEPYPTAVALRLSTGLTRFNTVHAAPSYSRTATGLVSVSGMFKGAVPNGGHITTLPDGFRPAHLTEFATLSNDGRVDLYVYPDGRIVAATALHANYTSLNPIVFPAAGTVEYYNGVAASGWTSSGQFGYGMDRVGRVWFRGDLAKTPATHNEIAAHVPVGYRPEYDQHFIMYSPMPNDRGLRRMNQDGSLRYYGFVGGQLGLVHMHQNFYHHADVKGWVEAELENGWVQYGNAVFAPVSYRKDADGVVSLRGLMKSGTMGATAFTLPPGFRPKETMLSITTSGDQVARVDILADGSVQPKSGTNAWFGLDGVSFIAAQ